MRNSRLRGASQAAKQMHPGAETRIKFVTTSSLGQSTTADIMAERKNALCILAARRFVGPPLIGPNWRSPRPKAASSPNDGALQLPHSPPDGGDMSDGSNGESLIPVIAPRVIVVHCAAALFRKHTPLI